MPEERTGVSDSELRAKIKAALDDDMVDEIARKVVEPVKKQLDPKTQVDLLTRGYKSLLTVTQFKPGQVVKWKEGMQNRRYPSMNEPAIVIRVFEEPFLDSSQELTSPFFREPLDILLGVIDSDGDFLTYYYDKRRFELFT